MSKYRKDLAKLAAALHEDGISRMTVAEMDSASAFFFCLNPQCGIPGWMAFQDIPSHLCPRCEQLGRKVKRREFEPVLIARRAMESKDYKEPQA